MNTQKVKFREKTGLFMINIGNTPLMYFLSTYFMIFYSTVVGLDIKALATLFLISKVMDGLSDPVMGFLMDKFPGGRMGKFRPMLILGTIICVINYILLWFGAVWSPVGQYAIVYATYLLLGWTFDIMDISKNSMVPVMSVDEKERNSLSLTQALGALVGGTVLAVVSPLIVAEATLHNYYILIFAGMAAVLLFSIAGAFLIKERAVFSSSSDEKYNFRELIGFFRLKPIFGVFIASLLLGIGSNLSSGTSTFFYTYVMGDLTIMSGVSVASLIAMLIGMVIAPPLANKLGKRNIYIASIVMSLIFTGIRLFDVTSILLLYICSFFGGIGGGMVVPMTTSIQADNTTYVYYKTGKRAEAAIASLNSFVTKVAQGIGGAIPGYVLAATGFVTGATEQPESINSGIIVCLLVIPVALCIIGVVAFQKLYNITSKEAEEMRTGVVAGNE